MAQRNYRFWAGPKTEMMRTQVVVSNRYYDYETKTTWGRWRHDKEHFCPGMTLRSLDLPDLDWGDESEARPYSADSAYNRVNTWTNNYWTYACSDSSQSVCHRQKTRRLTNQEAYEHELEREVNQAIVDVQNRWQKRFIEDAQREFNPLMKFLASKKNDTE